MSDLPSVKKKIQVESTRFRSAVSEFLIQTIGKSINFLIDKYDSIFLSNNVRSIDIVNVSVTSTYISYTVPDGKIFVGVAYTDNNASGSSFRLNSSQVLGTFEQHTSYPFVAGPNDLIEIVSEGTSNMAIRGIIVSNSALT